MARIHKPDLKLRGLRRRERTERAAGTAEPQGAASPWPRKGLRASLPAPKLPRRAARPGKERRSFTLLEARPAGEPAAEPAMAVAMGPAPAEPKPRRLALPRRMPAPSSAPASVPAEPRKPRLALGRKKPAEATVAAPAAGQASARQGRKPRFALRRRPGSADAAPAGTKPRAAKLPALPALRFPLGSRKGAAGAASAPATTNAGPRAAPPMAPAPVATEPAPAPTAPVAAPPGAVAAAAPEPEPVLVAPAAPAMPTPAAAPAVPAPAAMPRPAEVNVDFDRLHLRVDRLLNETASRAAAPDTRTTDEKVDDVLADARRSRQGRRPRSSGRSSRSKA